MLFQEGGLFDSINIEENVAYPLLNQKASHNGKPKLDAVHQRVTEALDALSSWSKLSRSFQASFRAECVDAPESPERW